MSEAPRQRGQIRAQMAPAALPGAAGLCWLQGKRRHHPKFLPPLPTSQTRKERDTQPVTAAWREPTAGLHCRRSTPTSHLPCRQPRSGPGLSADLVGGHRPTALLRQGRRAGLRLAQAASLSLSSYDRCSGPFIIFVALHCTCSGSAMSLLSWGAQDHTQHSKCRGESVKAVYRRCLASSGDK